MNLVERLRDEVVRTVELDIMHHEAADRIEALEAHNAVLRDALENIPIGYHAKIMGRDCVCGICESNRRVQEALASTPESSLKEIRRAERERINLLESGPAIHFCHRFAVVLECTLLADTSSSVWDEATTLLSEYSEAQDKWREAAGEPYVSGFGKD